MRVVFDYSFGVTAAARKATTTSPLAEFVAPSWDEPLDTELYLKRAPSDVLVRGMYFSGILRELAAKNPARPSGKSYRAFHSYPLQEFMSLMIEASRELYPQATTRQAMRQLGWIAFQDFADSTIGKVILGAMSHDVRAIFSLTSKAYGVSLTRARVTLIESGDQYVILMFEDVYNFIDSYHVGAFEGVLRLMGKQGEVKINRIAHCEAKILITWN